MEIPTTPLIFTLFILVVLSGCATLPQGEGIDVVFIGDINVSESSFHMDRHLSSGGGIPDRKEFRNVRIELYSENGEILYSSEVGDLQADQGRLNVSIISDQIPEYIVIRSPEFWNEQVMVAYFQRSSDSRDYSGKDIYSKSELPISLAQRNRTACH